MPGKGKDGCQCQHLKKRLGVVETQNPSHPWRGNHVYAGSKYKSLQQFREAPYRVKWCKTFHMRSHYILCWGNSCVIIIIIIIYHHCDHHHHCCRHHHSDDSVPGAIVASPTNPSLVRTTNRKSRDWLHTKYPQPYDWKYWTHCTKNTRKPFRSEILNSLKDTKI